MSQDAQIQHLLAEIHKTLVHISGSLEVIARVAAKDHPEATIGVRRQARADRSETSSPESSAKPEK